ncbi:hypothetical protein C427_2893 [Paraglaciecola psychrophila 170]|uniref:Uncharacterized protein n=1 Tax=Paraglaciecola psychrophila 170 TaxID=1129794 RepID=M4S2W8_9ALTE|nr:hypothetical protein C427_2893 [Paraglaciecola psychrophila 170]
MKKLKLSIILILVALLISWLCFRFYRAYQPQPIRLQGQIQAQQYSISSKVPGRIEQVLVRKGDQVKKSQLIFTLYSPEITAKLDQAIAGQKAAGAMAKEAEKGARTQEIQASKDQWLKAKSATELMEKTYQRINNLYKDGVIAEQKSDEANTSAPCSKIYRECCISNVSVNSRRRS